MNTVLRGLQSDIEQQLVEGNEVDLTQTSKEIIQLELLIDNVKNAGRDNSMVITLEFLDPHGHSMILDESAVERELTDEEIATLPTGPDPAVFSA
jgi:C4-type Zn-finger protein